MPYWRLFYHLVWSTKFRIPALHDDQKATELRRALWTSVRELDLQLHALGIQPDHVHVAYSAPPRVSVAEAAQRLKGSSSHYLGKQFPGDWPGWQTEYGVVGFGQQSLARVVEYVTHQDERHRENNLWLEMERGLDESTSSTTPTKSPSGTSGG